MKVFLGWSGDTGHNVALALHSWLPRVIQTIVPYGPLAQFQHTVNEKDDLKKLIFSINDKKQSPLEKNALEEAFEMWWPQFEGKLGQIEKEGPSKPVPKKLDIDAMLERVAAAYKRNAKTHVGTIVVPGRVDKTIQC
jgi:hypothetical protein